MNARHAAALALVGWYLLLPPISDGTPDVTAPLSRWEILFPYETARDCQSSLFRIVGQALVDLQKADGTRQGELRPTIVFGDMCREGHFFDYLRVIALVFSRSARRYRGRGRVPCFLMMLGGLPITYLMRAGACSWVHPI
jgi:hypothetical protein